MSSSRVLLSASFVLLALASAGCGKSKVDQCNSFIERANASQSVMSKLHLDGEDPKQLEADAAKVDGEAKGVGGVELKDAKLVGFRDQYTANLTKLAANIRSFAKLQTDAKAGKASEAELKKLEADDQKIEADESKLIDEINKYCSN